MSYYIISNYSTYKLPYYTIETISETRTGIHKDMRTPLPSHKLHNISNKGKQMLAKNGCKQVTKTSLTNDDGFKPSE